MKQCTSKLSKSQTETLKNLPESIEEFRQQVRDKAKQEIIAIFCEEIDAYCGRKHYPNKGEYYRAGSRKVSLYLGGEDICMKMPRVRYYKDGKSGEHTLEMYRLCVESERLATQICEFVTHGMAIRSIGKVKTGVKGVSPSNVSRLFRTHIEAELAHFRTRDLSSFRFVGLMLDGVHFAKDIAVVIALGVTDTGEKVMLDFEVGSSENNVICDQLCGRLIARGFRYAAKHLIVVLDGSKALRYGVKKHFQNILIQTCLVHLQRNINARLSHTNKDKLAPLWKAVYDPKNDACPYTKFEKIKNFLRSHSQTALACLANVGEELTAFYKLNAPKAFERTFLSTNIIENSINNVRSKTLHIKRWRTETLMPEVWAGHCCICAEKSFNRIHAFKEISALIDALNQYARPV